MSYIFYEHNCLTEFDEAKYTELVRAEGYAQGYAEGYAKGYVEGKIKAVLSFLKDGLITESDAAVCVEMSLDDFRKTAAAYCN